MSNAKFELGEGYAPSIVRNPSPGFSLTLETTLSHKGRGWRRALVPTIAKR
jgi:hypothetical protein